MKSNSKLLTVALLASSQDAPAQTPSGAIAVVDGTGFALKALAGALMPALIDAGWP